MNLYKKNNTYGELKSVVLGSYYYPDYFKYIKNSAVREPLMKIAEEINQDLDQFENFLKTKNVKVIRPTLPGVDQFNGYIETHQQLPTPPLQPRNNHSVIGNELYKLDCAVPEIDQCLLQYNATTVDLLTKNKEFYQKSIQSNSDCFHNGTWFSKQKYQELAGPDWPQFEHYVQGAVASLSHIQQEIDSFQSVLKYNNRDFGPLLGPNIFPTDQGIVVDSNEYCNYAGWASENITDQKPYISISTGAGHTDGCFIVLGHNTILGIDLLINYKKYFPGYTVIPVPDKNYMDHVQSFSQMKSLVGGRWWVDGAEHNFDFINFVENYCSAWTGYVQETVFDVNVFAIDPDTVCVSNANQSIIDQLHCRGINAVVIPWRHRFFVDGGLHCITLDLYRE
jgi:hypothetical protein